MDEIDDSGLLRGTVWETNRGCPEAVSLRLGRISVLKIRQVR